MPLAKKDLNIDLIVFSENPRIERSLKKAFKSDKASVQVVSTAEVVTILSKLDSLYQKDFMRPLEETLIMLNFDNILFLVVDDAEILSTPPLPGSSAIAFNLRNKRAIANMRLKYRDIHRA